MQIAFGAKPQTAGVGNEFLLASSFFKVALLQAEDGGDHPNTGGLHVKGLARLYRSGSCSKANLFLFSLAFFPSHIFTKPMEA